MKSFKRNNPLENLDNTFKKPETIRMEEQKEAVVSEDQEEENKEKILYYSRKLKGFR